VPTTSPSPSPTGSPTPSPSSPVPDADDDEDDLGPDHDDDDTSASDDDDVWSWVLVSLLGALTIALFIILACFWRKFWVPDVMFSTPIFSPGPNPVSLGRKIVVNSPSTIERMLLYKILESTFSKKKTN
jgi:hypothetical protein